MPPLLLPTDAKPWKEASIYAIPKPSTDSPTSVGVITNRSEFFKINDFSGSVIQPKNFTLSSSLNSLVYFLISSK